MSGEKKEVVTDIIAAKRREADFILQNAKANAKAGNTTDGAPYTVCELERDLERVDEILREAYRLEEALKREKTTIEADALAVGGMVEASRKRGLFTKTGGIDNSGTAVYTGDNKDVPGGRETECFRIPTRWPVPRNKTAYPVQRKDKHMNGFEKYSRTWWVLASPDGCLLAKGHPYPKMPPYHLDALMDHVPALVAAPNKITLRDVRRLWNDRVRADGRGHAYYTRNLVHECKVRITIEEAT